MRATKLILKNRRLATVIGIGDVVYELFLIATNMLANYKRRQTVCSASGALATKRRGYSPQLLRPANMAKRSMVENNLIYFL